MEIPHILTEPLVLTGIMIVGIIFLVWLSRAMDLFMLLVTAVGVLLLGAVVVRTLIAFTGDMPFNPPV
jgi:hypothetical protein